MTSEIVTYKGKLVTSDGSAVDTSTDIYAANLDFLILNSDGSVKQNLIAQHPDRNGDFVAYGDTRSHSASVTVQQWECGPLRIYITGTNYVTYFDSLTNDQLRALQQNSDGQWILPTITLQKK
jgi:hypothetical protein